MLGSDFSVGIVADWLVTSAGSESVVKELINIYPSSELFSLIDFISEEERNDYSGKKAKTTFIQKLPFVKKNYQIFLPLMPLLLSKLTLALIM